MHKKLLYLSVLLTNAILCIGLDKKPSLQRSIKKVFSRLPSLSSLPLAPIARIPPKKNLRRPSSKSRSVSKTPSISRETLLSIDAAEELNSRFVHTVGECDDGMQGPIRPAYECSGILIRGAYRERKPHSWTLSAYNKEKNSFSMGYLRWDAQWAGFPLEFNAGFIMYPQLRTPRNKFRYKAYCAFPLDAHTDHRLGKHSCGQSEVDLKGESGPCHKQNIRTFQDWLAHYQRLEGPYAFYQNQCGFSMTLRSSAKLFKTVLRANHFLQNEDLLFKNSEIIIQAWDDEQPEMLPIEAFWYDIDYLHARGTARIFQSDYKNATGGMIVPVVAIQFPKMIEGTDERRQFYVWAAAYEDIQKIRDTKPLNPKEKQQLQRLIRETEELEKEDKREAKKAKKRSFSIKGFSFRGWN
ncbi:uncharacterized protein [Bemisia tabaci]|uniref:uncharacterized protein n=1 Tax=Bemisia tabaci TaxID=7038 RepID=UPI003B27CEEC